MGGEREVPRWREGRAGEQRCWADGGRRCPAPQGHETLFKVA